MGRYDLKPLADLFKAHADDVRASQMKAYMKGQYSYLGLPSPLRRELVKKFYSEYGYPGPDQVEEVVKECYDLPYREFKYFALELLVRMRKKAGHKAIDLYEWLLGVDPWWDTVDLIAPSLAGYHLQQYPEERQHYVDKWIASGDTWLQRSAILFQLKYKKNTDTALLTEVIMRLSNSSEFFIRKAIGWVLREYSKTDAGFVRRFVQEHELSGLSRREALKWLERH